MSAGSGWTSAMGARELAAVWAKVRIVSSSRSEMRQSRRARRRPRESRSVESVMELDAVGALLTVDAEADLGGGRVIDAMAECVARGLACEQWRVAGGAQDVGGAGVR